MPRSPGVPPRPADCPQSWCRPGFLGAHSDCVVCSSARRIAAAPRQANRPFDQRRVAPVLHRGELGNRPRR
jgi:hypothetical protein